MTLSRVLKLLSMGRNMPDFGSFDEIDKACDVACEAIKEKIERERPYPINIEELKAMANKPILFVNIIGDHKGFTCAWVLMFGYEKSNGNFLFINSVGNQHIYNERDYGETWLAYKTEMEKIN